MTKYIKGKDGKFAGSIGDGKASVPTAAPDTAPDIYPDSQISPGEAQALEDMFTRFQASRYAHHEKTVATMSRVLEERFPGLTSWAISVEQDDRDYEPDVHLAHIFVDGEKVYDRFNSAHGEFDLEEENLDPELTEKLLDVEHLAQRLEDSPTLAHLCARRTPHFVAEDETVTVYYFDPQQK